MADVLAKNKRERAAGMRLFATALSKRKGFNRRVSVERAADLLYGLTTEESHGVFVVDRGWSVDEWQRWATETLTTQLFPTANGARRKR